MTQSNEKLLNKDTYRHAQSHGLKLAITPDVKEGYAFSDFLGTVVTAGWSDSDFGAELTDTPENEGSVDDWLHLYCENVLHCTPNDIVWLPFSVTRKENESANCVVNDLNDGWTPKADGGIIFVKKETAKQYFNAKNLTNDMVKEIEDEFYKQIQELGALKNGKVHRISVDVIQEHLSGPVDKVQTSTGGIFEMYDLEIDEVANELLDNAIRSIESNDDSVSVTFKMNEKIENYGYLPAYIISQIKGNFGFTPAVSHTQLHPNDTFDISLSLNTIPPFLKLCVDTDKNLLEKLSINIATLVKLPTVKHISLYEANSLISKNNGYAEWPPVMTRALMMTLAEYIKDLTFIGAKPSNDRDTPEMKISQFLKSQSHSNTRSDLILAVINKMGGANDFLERKMQFDDRNRLEGLAGLATIEQKLAFFNENRDHIVLYGREVAKKESFSSFIELIENDLSKYGHNMDDIADAISSNTITMQDTSRESMAITGWVVSWTVNQLHKELLDFLYK